MSWTPEIVRARCVEAASVAAKLPPDRRNAASGFWPEITRSFEDMAGWGSERLAEVREMRLERLPPSSGAVSRHDEITHWISTMISDDVVRRTVWAWSVSQISGTSFASQCRKNNWVRGTAHRRLRAAFDAISARLCKDAVVLRLPADKWMRQQQPALASPLDMVGIVADDLPTSPTHQFIDGDRPRDLLTSPQAIEEFEKHLDRTNRDRRKEQERRKRKLLGLEVTSS
jgi:hypothetical protein